MYIFILIHVYIYCPLGWDVMASTGPSLFPPGIESEWKVLGVASLEKKKKSSNLFV